MKRALSTCLTAVALGLIVSSALGENEFDPGEFPGLSAEEGNRIICQAPAEFGGGYHQSPGLCAQAVGEIMSIKGGPGRLFKLFGAPNAAACVSANCPHHASEYRGD